MNEKDTRIKMGWEERKRVCIWNCVVKLWLNAINHNCYNLFFQLIFVQRIILRTKSQDNNTHAHWICSMKGFFSHSAQESWNWFDRCDDLVAFTPFSSLKVLNGTEVSARAQDFRFFLYISLCSLYLFQHAHLYIDTYVHTLTWNARNNR